MRAYLALLVLALGCRVVPGECSGLADRLCVRVVSDLPEPPTALVLTARASQPALQLTASFAEEDGVGAALRARGRYVAELPLPELAPGGVIEVEVQANAAGAPIGAGLGVHRAGQPPDLTVTLRPGVLVTPQVTAARPPSGPTAGGVPIVLRGHGFTKGPALRVRFGGVDGIDPRVLDDERIEVTLPPGKRQATQAEVVNGDGAALGSVPFLYYASRIEVGDFREWISPGSVPRALAVAQLSAGGSPDLVFAFSGTNKLRLLLDGPSWTPQFGPDTGLTPTAVAAGDLNGDGRDDVVVANAADNNVSVFLQDDAHNLVAAPRLGVSKAPEVVALALLDEDRNLDLIVGHSGSEVTVLVLRGNGDGTFRDPRPISVNLAAVTSLAVGALRQGARPDVVIGSRQSSALQILRNDGHGVLTMEPAVQAGQGVTGIVLGDWDGDGGLDAAAALGGASGVAVLRNTGGALGPGTILKVDPSPSSVAAGDMDGDGAPDLIVASKMTGAVQVLRNSAGTFVLDPLKFAFGVSPLALVATDLNGDGLADLAGITSADGIGVAYNRSM